MATYKDLQDRIALDYLNRMTLVPEVKRAINNAIKTVEANRYWFNETATALATVAGQSYVAVPSDFLILDRLEITFQSATFALRAQPFDVIRDMNVVAVRNLPTDYAYRGDRFNLALIPDSAYTVTCHYLQSLPVLSADSDSNAWTNEGQNLIAHMACVDLLSTVLQGDDRAIARHAEGARLGRMELVHRNYQRLTHRIRATYF